MLFWTRSPVANCGPLDLMPSECYIMDVMRTDSYTPGAGALKISGARAQLWGTQLGLMRLGRTTQGRVRQSLQ